MEELLENLFDDQSIQDKVILNLPIESPFGELKPLSIHDYMQRLSSISVISLNKKYLLAEYGKGYQEETGQTDNEIFTMLKDLNEKYSLFYFLREMFQDLLHHYIIITRYVKFYDYQYDKKNPQSRKDIDENSDDDTPLSEKEFTEAILEKCIQFVFSLDDDQFELYRKYILQLHGQSEPRAFLNPKLQRNEEKSKASKLKKKDTTPTLSTMVTSCAVYMGVDYSDIMKWNALQLQHSFQRISLFIQNNATTLFATVTSEVDLVNWSENITDNEKKEDMTLDTFRQNVSGV